MTSTEMHTAFKFGMDKLATLNYPNFLPEEIDLLLNQAQDRYVKQRYGLTNIKRQSFEETQKRTEDLKLLVRTVAITPAAYATDNIDVNARFFILPVDHWFIVQERAQITYADCNDVDVTELVEVRPIQHVEFDKVIKDAFKAPDKSKVLRLMENGRVELVADSTSTLNSYTLRYMKKPVRITLSPVVNCELSDHTHQEIVDEAVKIALEGIEAKRNSTFTPIIDNQKE